MANEIQNFGNGTGELYIVKPDGTTLYQFFLNDNDGRDKIMTHAAKSRIVPWQIVQDGRFASDPTTLQDLFDDTYGFRYFIHANATPSFASATEITREVVLRGLETNLPVATADRDWETNPAM